MVKWIVFGGWAVDAAILKPVFSDNSDFIDVNPIMPLLMESEILRSDWRNCLLDSIESRIPDKPFGIAGWSTGAMLAWSVASLIKPVAGVFLSATPSFCRRRESGFLYGRKRSVLIQMRENLAVNPEQTVRNFLTNCGIQNEPGDSQTACIPNQLIAGLHFLEQASLLPVEKPSFPLLFLHGTDDAIIPAKAGGYFSTKAGGTFVEHNGPHAFFINNPAAVSDTIDGFLQKVLG
jgi:pimeloyl-ACP methyl ester carboxylesterase